MELFMKFHHDRTEEEIRHLMLQRIKRLGIYMKQHVHETFDDDDEQNFWLNIATVVLKGLKSNMLPNLIDRITFYYEDQNEKKESILSP